MRGRDAADGRRPGGAAFSARVLTGCVVAGAAYYCAGWVGLRMSVFPETVSPIWPATGVAIASLAFLGLRAWPAITLAALLVELPGLGPAGALITSAGHTVEAVAGAWMLLRLGGARTFRTGGGVAAFLGIAAVAPVASTMAGALALARLDGPTPLAELALTWYIAHALGALVIAPALLLALDRTGIAHRSKEEWLTFSITTLAVVFIAFYPWRAEGLIDLRLGFLAVAPMAWAATRFGPLATSWSAALLSGAAIAGLAAGTVPLLGPPNTVLLQLQALTGLVTVLGLLLAANVQQRTDTIALLQRNEAELQHALDALRRSDRLKTRFINKAAHELRTPLTPLRLQTHMLAQGPLTDQQQRSVHTLERSVHRLGLLVDDLLDAARMENARLALRRTDVPSAAIIEDAMQQARLRADEAGVALSGDADDSMIYGDRAALGRVVGDLMANGIKHTPRGGRLTVQASGGETTVTIVVQDGGPGIAPEDREQLFEPFSEGSTPGGSEGPGLQLYIVRSLVEAHDGTIAVEGEGGARFVVRLPASAAIQGT